MNAYIHLRGRACTHTSALHARPDPLKEHEGEVELIPPVGRSWLALQLLPLPSIPVAAPALPSVGTLARICLPPPFANPTPNPSRFSNRLAFAPGGESVLPRMRYFLTSSLPILQVLLRQSFKISTGGLWSGFFRPNLLNNPSSNHFTL